MDSSYINKAPDFTSVVNYMSNSDKVKSKYISGYMCEANKVIDDFIRAQSDVLNMRSNRTKTGNIAYHLVQSFPEDLDISDEEVHQCGLELIEKLDKHQAYICSHVHPVLDEEGEVHGKCKHNHILINAYIHPNKIDPKKPNVIKYNPCTETYRQLQIWNDEIAIDHGLPIIRNPDMERRYSWLENSEANKGLSWKQQVKHDIDLTKQKSRDWKDFVKAMNQLGYIINEGKHTTYIAPDGQHRVRGTSLGERYTKKNILKYWDLRNEIKDDILSEVTRKNQVSLYEMVNNTRQKLYVYIPLGGNNPDTQSYSLSLNKKILSQQAIDSYFDFDKYYEIINENDQVVDSITGLELHKYFTEVLKVENEKLKQIDWWNNEQEKRRWLKLQAQERKEQQYYTDERFKNSRTKQTYKIGLYTKDGRLKTDLELIFTVAVVVIHNEQGLWEAKKIPDDRVQEAYFGPADWKAQNMMEALQIAREEGIDNQFDMENRLQTIGAALSRARATVKRNENVKNKMETLKKSIDDYESLKSSVESIFNMPDNDDKFHLLNANKDKIEQYKSIKNILHIYKVETPDDILDFKKRYVQVEKNIEESQQLLDEKKEEYRRLKKLQYSTSLAQDVYYCYGPEYVQEKEVQIDYEHEELPMITKE